VNTLIVINSRETLEARTISILTMPGGKQNRLAYDKRTDYSLNHSFKG